MVKVKSIFTAALFSTISFGLGQAETEITFVKNDKCPHWCNDSATCDSLSCQACEFTCGGKCLYEWPGQCEIWCRPGDEDHQCGLKRCKGCKFCKPDRSLTCYIATFEDVTSSLFPKSDSYWYEWKHSRKPYDHYSTPLLVDINNDGVLDYFNSLHGHRIDEHGYDRMELGESIFEIDDGNGTTTIQPKQRYRRVSDRIIIEDPDLLDPRVSMDPHNQNIVDLDGDGILDMLISSGGGNGDMVQGKFIRSRDNFLLWGESMDDVTGSDITIFRGGRNAAKEAGVHMRHGRGRTNYLMDVNGDGLLDIFCLQDRLVTNRVRPGVLLINQGNRTWKEDWSMREYAPTMLLTDADGDGLAQEIVMSRGYCFPNRNGPEKDENYPKLGPFNARVKNFCSTRPVGSTAIFKYNHETSQMDEISKKYHDISPDNNKQPSCCPHGSFSGFQDCNARSIATADLDGDLKTDHLVLYQSKIVIYFSSDRRAGELPQGSQYVGATINLPPSCSSGRSLHVVDWNNSGKEVIVVMCVNVGSILVFTRTDNTGRKWTRHNSCNDNGSLGALDDVNLVGMSEPDVQALCKSESEISKYPKKINKICNQYKKNEKPFKMPTVKTSGLCLTDFDNDGFIDAIMTHNFGYMRFYRNVHPSPKRSANQFIAFQLKGSGSVNLYGIGSTVLLEMKNKRNGKVKTQFREISTYQHSSNDIGCTEERIIFGLGSVSEPIKVTVRWPNGRIQEMNLTGWTFSSYLTPIVLEYSHVTSLEK